LPRRLEEYLAKGRAELERFFDEAPAAELREIVEKSFCSELVNILLDLRQSCVKSFFERVVVGRKRVAAPAVALYHYKLYLRNPLPLEVSGTDGETQQNYYAKLGLPRDATPEEIDEAHKLLTKALAPEAFPPESRHAGAEQLKDICDAFNVLRNPKKREAADRLLPNISYLYPKREHYWLEAVKRLLS
jgi:hypothetical protein